MTLCSIRSIRSIRIILLHCFFILAAMTAAPGFAQNAIADDTLFGQLGGKDGIGKIVKDFVPLLQGDARINKLFIDVDIPHLEKMLAEQFCSVSDGPCQYTGKSMKLIHDGLNISNAQFNALVEDLQLAMDKNAIPSRTQNKLLAKLAPMQRDVVTR